MTGAGFVMTTDTMEEADALLKALPLGVIGIHPARAAWA